MKSRQEILDILSNHLGQIKKEYGVSKIGLFGSVVRSEQSETSDIDILVEFSRATGMVQFIRLEEELQGLLGVKVDLVTQKALKKHIGQQILREVQYVTKRDIRDYLSLPYDFQPIFRCDFHQEQCWAVEMTERR